MRERLKMGIRSLAEIMKEPMFKNMSHTEIAKKSGVSRSVISLYVNGQRPISGESARKICVAFGLDQATVYECIRGGIIKKLKTDPSFFSAVRDLYVEKTEKK